jgi:hypothetical protein
LCEFNKKFTFVSTVDFHFSCLFENEIVDTAFVFHTVSQNPSEIRKVLLYTADTCEGSSGATVISFKKMKLGNTEEIVLDLWMHSGVCRKHGLNASTMKGNYL